MADLCVCGHALAEHQLSRLQRLRCEACTACPDYLPDASSATAAIWTGVSARGVHHTGRIDAATTDVVEFVRIKYQRNWKRLRVVTASDQVVVGEIFTPDRYRTWWAQPILTTLETTP